MMTTQFQGLVLSPVKEVAGEYCFVCSPTEANFWTIYGVDFEGLSQALEDTLDPGPALRQWHQVTGLPVAYTGGNYFIGPCSLKKLPQLLKEKGDLDLDVLAFCLEGA